MITSLMLSNTASRWTHTKSSITNLLHTKTMLGASYIASALLLCRINLRGSLVFKPARLLPTSSPFFSSSKACAQNYDKTQGYYAVAEQFWALCIYFQPNGMSNDYYYLHFKSMVYILSRYTSNGVLGSPPLLANIKLKELAMTHGYSAWKPTRLPTTNSLPAWCFLGLTQNVTMPSAKSCLTVMPWEWTTTLPLSRKC